MALFSRRRIADDQDIRFVSRLIFGREVTRVVKSGRPQTVFGVAKRLFASPEFQFDLITPLLQGGQYFSLPVDTDVFQADLARAKRHFNCPDLAAGERSYARMLALCLTKDRLARAFTESYSESYIDPLVKALGGVDTREAPEFELVVEALSAAGAKGYARRLTEEPGGGTPLELDFFAGSSFLGRARADGMRRDVQDLNGGDGRVGFQLTFSRDDRIGSADTLFISIREAESGALLRGGLSVPVGRLQQTADLAAIRRAAERLEALVREGGASADIGRLAGQLKKAVPALEQASALPIAAWPHIAALTGGPRAPAESRPLAVSAVSFEALTAGQPIREVVSEDWVLITDASDQVDAILMHHAAAALRQSPDVLYLSCDFDHIEGDNRADPHLFGAFDLDLLLARGDYTEAALFHRSLLGDWAKPAKTAAGVRLRAALAALEIGGRQAFGHLPGVMWHKNWPQDPLGLSRHAIADERRALINEEAADMLSLEKAKPHTDKFGRGRAEALSLTWPRPAADQSLSIIIPTRDRLEMIKPCVESLLRTLEPESPSSIVIVDNGSSDLPTLEWLSQIAAHHRVSVLRDDRPFNWSALNNNAVKGISSELLLFLNNDTLALNAGWEDSLRRQLARHDVGCVGARLLYEDGSIQHAGVALYSSGVGIHEAVGEACDQGLFLGRSALTHACSAVTGAFMGVRRSVFDQSGGFEEQALSVAFNDVDFCLKVQALGYVNLYCPEITFTHLESKSRGFDHQSPEKAERAARERDYMEQHWQPILAQDPFYPPLFRRSGKAYSVVALHRELPLLLRPPTIRKSGHGPAASA